MIFLLLAKIYLFIKQLDIESFYNFLAPFPENLCYEVNPIKNDRS